MKETKTRFWNPYVAGVALGLVLLAAYLVTARGLGASGAANRLAVAAVNSLAPAHVDSNRYMKRTKAGADGPIHPLNNWFVFMALGVLMGGFVAAYTGRRLKREIIRGPNITARFRLMLALGGGVLMGVGARLALGCTSGQALTGGALLSVGGWIFMMAVFAGGYAFAAVVRRQYL